MKKRISNNVALETLKNGGKALVRYNSVLIEKKLSQVELEELYKGCNRIPQEDFTIIGFITIADYKKILEKVSA